MEGCSSRSSCPHGFDLWRGAQAGGTQDRSLCEREDPRVQQKLEPETASKTSSQATGLEVLLLSVHTQRTELQTGLSNLLSLQQDSVLHMFTLERNTIEFFKNQRKIS